MLGELLNIVKTDGIEEIIRFAFSFICHQDESRLLLIFGDYMPLCPRCTGLHLGFFTTATVLLFINRLILPPLSKVPKFILIFLVTLSGIHWLGGRAEVFESNLYASFLTGLLSGSSFGFLILTYKKYERKSFNFLIGAATGSVIFILPLAITSLATYESKYFTFLLGFIVLFNIISLVISILSILSNANKEIPQTIKPEVLK